MKTKVPWVLIWSATSMALALYAHAGPTPSNPRAEYQQTLDQINAMLGGVETETSCPALDLVVTCGNGKCERNQGENAGTCPVDCPPPLIKSYNSQTLCREITRLAMPSSAEEAAAFLKEAAAHHQKVRVVGRLHSANEQLCAEGWVISTEKLDRVIGIEAFEGKETVVTEPGVTLFELAEWLHARNRSLGYNVIGFRGVTVAGSAATGAHGSSVSHSNIISSAVESVTLLDARGELHEYSAQTTDPVTWKALRANLGMLGLVVRMRMRIQPQFNLKVQVSFEDDDALFGNGGAFGLVKNCDYAIINWFPDTGKFMRSCGVETTEPAQAGANNRLLDPAYPEFIINPIKKVLQYGACHHDLSCLLERVRYLTLQLSPPFETSGGWTETLVGPSHRMMTSELTPYQKGFTQMDWEIAVPYSKAQAALEAVRKLASRRHICLPLVGIFLRFAPAEDTTLLAHSVARGVFKKGEPVLFIEMPVYLPMGFSPAQRKSYDSPYVEFAMMLIERFGGRPHWAKNRDWALKLAIDLHRYGENFKQFRSVAKQLDPDGVFRNDWGRDLGF